MPEERPSDPLLSSLVIPLLSACGSHAVSLNWSRSLVLRIRRMAAVAPGLALRIFLMFLWKSANSSRMACHVGHLSRTCRTVIASSSQAQRLLHTSGTLPSYRKFENPIFPVRSCMSSALCAFVLPAWRRRNSTVINNLRAGLSEELLWRNSISQGFW